MGYQALLFCPDEKTARTVTQVLSELDFAVTACTEPFAAVKKLMGEPYDAVVVDCDNEQNATLVFKSARNAPNNQSSLAVAVVEGQVGVAKAFRIGANLVLTKPINVEQAKGTLRVARGLLRKGEAAKTAAAAATTGKSATSAPAPTKPPASTPGVAPSRPVPAQAAPAMAGSPVPAPRPTVVASASPAAPVAPSSSLKSAPQISSPKINSAASSPWVADTRRGKSDKTESTESNEPEFLAPPPGAVSPRSLSGFGSVSASAPAPARETKLASAPEEKPTEIVAEPERQVATDLVSGSASASTLTFGGTASSDAEPAPNAKNKKPILAVAVVLLLAIGGYLAWTQLGGKISWPLQLAPSAPTTSAAVPKVAPSAAPAAKVAPAVPPASPAQSTVPTATVAAQPTDDTDTSSDAPTTVRTGKARPGQSKTSATANSPQPTGSALIANKAPATTIAGAPMVIKKNGVTQRPPRKVTTTADAPAPSLSGITSAENVGALPNLSDAGDARAPVLQTPQTMNVSQGVSQGLVLKRVQPAYPATALRMQIEGPVELLATISKAGNITAVKVLSGDPQLARAAVEAVKQWKYKPYELNSEPVEIQTQITVKFKLPR